MLIVNERYLRRILTIYLRHFNTTRPTSNARATRTAPGRKPNLHK
jgi:hypothetical protein